MIEFTTFVDIDRPPDEVFAVVSRFENTPAWNYFVIDVTQRSAGPPGVGTVFHQVRKTDQQDFKIVALDPGRSVEIMTTPGSSPSFKIRYDFEAIDSGTRVRNAWQLGTGHHPLLERLGSHRIRTAVTENLHKLKQLLENGTTQLQDGRTSTLA